MVAKETFVRVLDEEIERWDARFGELEARVRELEHPAKHVFERELAQFRDRRDQAYAMVRQLESTLREWRDAADHSWDELFDEADRAVSRLREIWQRLVTKVGSPPASRGDGFAGDGERESGPERRTP